MIISSPVELNLFCIIFLFCVWWYSQHYCGYHYRVFHRKCFSCTPIVILVVDCCNDTTQLTFPPNPSSIPEGSCTTFGKLFKTILWVLHFSAIWAQLFFYPFFGNVFQLKDDLRIFSPADKIKLRGQGTARGEVEPAEFHSKWRKVLVSVAVILTIFLPKFWPKQLAFSDLIAFLGGQEPITLVGALRLLRG